MDHIQFGDHVMVCSEESRYNLKTGTVCSIDIYGMVKVHLLEEEQMVKFKRDDLKLLYKKYNTSPYLDHNPSFIRYLEKKYREVSKNPDKLLRLAHLKQLIDLALDLRDEPWFLALSSQLKHYKD